DGFDRIAVDRDRAFTYEGAMGGYLARRLLASLPVLLIVSVVVFALLRAIPGDAAVARASQGNVAGSGKDLDLLRHDLGLDRPLPVQYLDWLGSLLRGTGGDSLTHGSHTVDNLREAMPVTLEITVATVLLSVLIAVPLGVLSAVRRNTAFD